MSTPRKHYPLLLLKNENYFLRTLSNICSLFCYNTFRGSAISGLQETGTNESPSPSPSSPSSLSTVVPHAVAVAAAADAAAAAATLAPSSEAVSDFSTFRTPATKTIPRKNAENVSVDRASSSELAPPAVGR